MRISRLFSASVVFLLTLVPQAVGAQALYNPLGSTSLPVLIGRVIRAGLGVVGTLALVMVIYGGFMWLTAAGNPEKIRKGMMTFLWSAIGILVIFSAFAVSNFVINTLSSAASS